MKGIIELSLIQDCFGISFEAYLSDECGLQCEYRFTLGLDEDGEVIL